MGRLQNKVALVLGAGTKDNMGQVIARRLAAEGAKVRVSGRNEAVLKALAAEIGGSYALCDITSEKDVDALVTGTVSALGGVDIAVNASGRNLTKPFLETTKQEIMELAEAQFAGPFLLCQALVRNMTRGGSVIQITSATATIMLDNHAAYMGTKAGFDHALRAIANEFGERGIRFNSVAPGLTNTPMAAMAFSSEAVVNLFKKEYPLGRLGTAEDVADTCVFVASDECFMTGQTFHVTGGLTLRRNPRWSEMMAAFGAAE